MPTTFTRETKPATTFTKEPKPNGLSYPSLTWDQAELPWDAIPGTWDNPLLVVATVFTKETKPTTSYTKETKP